MKGSVHSTFIIIDIYTLQIFLPKIQFHFQWFNIREYLAPNKSAAVQDTVSTTVPVPLCRTISVLSVSVLQCMRVTQSKQHRSHCFPSRLPYDLLHTRHYVWEDVTSENPSEQMTYYTSCNKMAAPHYVCVDVRQMAPPSEWFITHHS
jgi:hypothetical protein